MLDNRWGGSLSLTLISFLHSTQVNSSITRISLQFWALLALLLYVLVEAYTYSLPGCIAYIAHSLDRPNWEDKQVTRQGRSKGTKSLTAEAPLSSIVKSSTTNYGLDAWKCEWEMTMETFHNDLGCRFTSPKNIEWYKLVKAQKETLLNFLLSLKIVRTHSLFTHFLWSAAFSRDYSGT